MNQHNLRKWENKLMNKNYQACMYMHFHTHIFKEILFLNYKLHAN